MRHSEVMLRPECSVKKAHTHTRLSHTHIYKQTETNRRKCKGLNQPTNKRTNKRTNKQTNKQDITSVAYLNQTIHYTIDPLVNYLRYDQQNSANAWFSSMLESSDAGLVLKRVAWQLLTCKPSFQMANVQLDTLRMMSSKNGDLSRLETAPVWNL